MSNWGSGYVIDTAYVHDFCRAQTPAMLALVALSGGVAAAGGSGEPLALCDLGCGQGYTANLIASANPQARVFGFDFNPSHVANARALASASGLTNVEFREADFNELLVDPALPQFDIMGLHGVFSWVSVENRRAIVALVRKQLRPGGLLYISYDCMPGWAAVAPLRRIFARHFAPAAALPSQAAVERALVYSDALRAADSQFHRMFPQVEAQMARLKATPRAYLAHEILTRDWEAFSFGEVAAELAEAKLTFVSSAHLSDSIDRLNFTEAQLAFLASLDDRVLAETTRDMMLCRQFRRDVFVKGFAPRGALSLRARWLDTRFAPTTPPNELIMTFETALGKHQFHPRAHGPLVDVLREGPVRLGDAVKRAFNTGADWDSMTDVIKVLVARGDLQPALPAAGDSSRAASTRAFNDALLARVMEGEDLFYLASPVTGGGVKVDRLTLLYLYARRNGVANVADYVAKRVQGAVLTGDDGKPLSPEESSAALAKKLARVETDIAPLLQQLGID